ncbi:hypothetical protein DSUL_100162 [Desulfovibrionales bacterium]
MKIADFRIYYDAVLALKYFFSQDLAVRMLKKLDDVINC